MTIFYLLYTNLSAFLKNLLNSRLRIPVLCIFFLYLVSCTEKIDIQLDNTFSRLVVYGTITTDTMAHKVELKKSADYFSNQPAEMVSNALVELEFGDSSLVLTEKEDSPGSYFTPDDFYGLPGNIYTLNIKNVDIDQNDEPEIYSATSSLPEVNKIDSITLKYTKNSFFEAWEIQIWTYDPGEIENFYLFKTLINNKLVSDTLPEIIAQNDDFFNGNPTLGITAQILDQTEEDETVIPGDTVIFEVNGITEEYYNFILEAQAEVFGQNPLFSGPPANISSNITNGALGFFTAYSIERAERIVPLISD